MFCGGSPPPASLFQRPSVADPSTKSPSVCSMKGSPPAGFDYDAEFDGQTGSLGISSIRGWAGYAGVGKTFPTVAASPRVFVEGNYVSGAKNLKSREWNTFDQIYPSNHDKFSFIVEV